MTDGPSAAGHQVLTTVARGGAVNFLGTVISAIAGLGLVLLVTRFVDIGLAGQFFAATAAYTVVAAVAGLGTDVGLARLLPRVDPDHRGSHSRVLVRAALLPVLVLTLVLTVVGVLLAPWLAQELGLTDPGAPTAILMLALGVAGYVVGDVCLGVTRAAGIMRTTVVIDKIGRAALQVLLVSIAALAGAGLVVLTVAWVLPYVASGVVAAYAATVLVRRYSDVRTGPDARSFGAVSRDFWSFTWPRSIARISQMIVQRADIVIIGVLLGGTEAAIYTAATRFVPLGQFVTAAIQQAAQPRFSMLLARHDLTTLRELYRTTTAWSIALGWPIYATLAAAPHVYLWLFGHRYGSGGPVVTVMALGMLVGAATGPVDTMLLMAGRSALSLFNSLVALVLDIGLCLLLIPRMGILGAGVAWAVAVGTRALVATWQVHRELGLRALSRAGLVAMGLVAACFGLPFGMLTLSGPAHPVVTILTGLAALVAYGVGLWRWRRILRLSAFRGFIRPRQERGGRQAPLVESTPPDPVRPADPPTSHSPTSGTPDSGAAPAPGTVPHSEGGS